MVARRPRPRLPAPSRQQDRPQDDRFEFGSTRPFTYGTARQPLRRSGRSDIFTILRINIITDELKHLLFELLVGNRLVESAAK
ncbi:MAG: hypothetical protein J0I16_23350 [Rhizobiales bacterium]|nr:hypothetical protein [Hyphomicrobiales bacterium]